MKFFVVFLVCSLPAFSQCASATRFWVGGGSTNTWIATGPTNWATTSGGFNNATVPTTTDLVCFDGNSGTGISTISANITVSTFDFTNYTGTMAVGTSQLKWTGSVAISGSGVTWTFSTGLLDYTGTGSTTLTLLGSNLPIIAVGGTGNITLGASINGCAQLQLSQGTFTANGFNVTCASVQTNNTTMKVLNMGTGTWTLTGIGAVWNFNAADNLTVNPSTATIVISDTSASQKQFSDVFLTSYANNIFLLPGGTGGVYFKPTGNQSYGTWIGSPGGLIELQSTYIFTVANTNFTGTSGNNITLENSTASSAATIAIPGNACWSYVTVPNTTAGYITVTGGTAYAQNSSIGANASGITASACPGNAVPYIAIGPSILVGNVSIP